MANFVVKIPKRIDAFLEAAGLKTEDPEVVLSDIAGGVTITLFWSSAPAAVPKASRAPLSVRTHTQPSTDAPKPDPVSTVIKVEPLLPSDVVNGENASKRRLLQEEENGAKDLTPRHPQNDGLPERKKCRDEQLPSSTAKQPPTMAKQLPTAAKQPPTTTKQPPTTAKQPPTAAKQPPTTAKLPPITAKQSPTVSKEPPTSTMQPPFTAKQTPTTTVQQSTTANQPSSSSGKENRNPEKSMAQKKSLLPTPARAVRSSYTVDGAPVPHPRRPPCLPGEPVIVSLGDMYYAAIRRHGCMVIIEANCMGLLTNFWVDGVDPGVDETLNLLQTTPKVTVYPDLRNTILKNIYDYVGLEERCQFWVHPAHRFL